jgi:hypothetical protein
VTPHQFPAPVAHPTFAQRARKFLVAAVGVVGQIVTLALAQGLIPAAYVPWLSVVIATATMYGVWRVPNARAARTLESP